MANRVKEYPYLFKDHEVRAILEGMKTQLRVFANDKRYKNIKVGDVLWGRETFYPLYKPNEQPKAIYRADYTFEDPEACWHPSTHMPRFASRLILPVVGVREERLQEITEEDAIAEGVVMSAPYVGVGMDGSPIESHTIDWAPSDYFAEIWDSFYAKKGRGWDNNDEVKVITFERRI